MITNIITQCIKLFSLLPTTPLYKWCIAADWIQEEQNIETTSNAIRDDIFVLEVVESARGDGRGYGDGYKYGRAYGHAYGNGRGNGAGASNGIGCGHTSAMERVTEMVINS